ncbi:MAG: HAD hydrolase-like protein [Thermotogaceae bacterium]|nr:HAD hydrolase-like protein [Thermotogaceae bacterium]
MFGVSKDERFHVGQSVFHDIVSAKRYGLKTILIKKGIWHYT